MPKLFLKLRDPNTGSKISIPLEVPEGYDFFKIIRVLHQLVITLEWETTIPPKPKKKAPKKDPK